MYRWKRTVMTPASDLCLWVDQTSSREQHPKTKVASLVFSLPLLTKYQMSSVTFLVEKSPSEIFCWWDVHHPVILSSFDQCGMKNNAQFTCCMSWFDVDSDLCSKFSVNHLLQIALRFHAIVCTNNQKKINFSSEKTQISSFVTGKMLYCIAFSVGIKGRTLWL